MLRSGLPNTMDVGGAEGTRTPDPLDANEVRYQLRYSPLGHPRVPNAAASTKRLTGSTRRTTR